jgi:hypothetical protein
MRGSKIGLVRGAVFIGALVLATASARAAEVTATVVVPPQNVSVSYGASTPAIIYKVTFKNIGTSPTSNARFLATTSVGGTSDTAVKAVFGTPPSTDYNCTPTTFDRTTIDCAIGTLQVGESSREFTVTVMAPTAGTSVGFAWEAIHNSGDSPGLSNGDAGTATPVVLEQLNANAVKTFVPLNTELVFFTNTGIATKEDPWATRVRIPGSRSETLAEVLENVAISNCVPAAGLTTCNTTNLTIPLPVGVTFGQPGTAGAFGLEQFLRITLIRDASTIARSASISSAVVYYQKDPTPENPSPTKEAVPPCGALNPTLPQPGKPCEDLTQRKQYPRKSTGKTFVEPGYEGDWQFVIYATDNGRYGDY